MEFSKVLFKFRLVGYLTVLNASFKEITAMTPLAYMPTNKVRLTLHSHNLFKIKVA